MLARYTADAWRGRVYAVRYFLLFISAGVAIGMIALLHERGGFAAGARRQRGDRAGDVRDARSLLVSLIVEYRARRQRSPRSRRNNQNSGGIRSSTLTRMRFFTSAAMRLR